MHPVAKTIWIVFGIVLGMIVLLTYLASNTLMGSG